MIDHIGCRVSGQEEDIVRKRSFCTTAEKRWKRGGEKCVCKGQNQGQHRQGNFKDNTLFA